MMRLTHYFFPAIRQEELRKFVLLGITAFFIGTYWLLRLLKQTIFFKIAFPASLGWDGQQGALFQPIAKVCSPFIILAVVLIYSKLVDFFKKDQLFYIICAFYGLLFSAMCVLLMIQEHYGDHVLGKCPLAALGWVSFFAAESFGSLIVALFWSFTNSITDSNSAKTGFPFILTMMQLGAMTGSIMLLLSTKLGLIWPFIAVAIIFMAAIAITIAYLMRTIPANQLIGNELAHATENNKDGFFEGFTKGLTLLLSRRYLIGIMIISTLYDVVVQWIDYFMHCQASLCPEYASVTNFSWFQGIYGFSAHLFSFFVALFATSSIIRSFGTRITLLLYPIIFAIILTLLFIFFMVSQASSLHLLWATLGAFIIIKGTGFAINIPAKEIMYIPTSKDVKFKSKEWIDVFGARIAQAGGAQITNIFKHNLTNLMIYGTFMSFGLIGVWLAAAFYVGKKNQELVRDNKIIE